MLNAWGHYIDVNDTGLPVAVALCLRKGFGGGKGKEATQPGRALQLDVPRRDPVQRHECVAADEAWFLLLRRKGLCVPSRAICWPAHVYWLRFI